MQGMSTTALSQAFDALGEAHRAAEDLLRQRCARGMSTPEEERVVVRINEAYMWIAAEEIGRTTTAEARR